MQFSSFMLYIFDFFLEIKNNIGFFMEFAGRNIISCFIFDDILWIKLDEVMILDESVPVNIMTISIITCFNFTRI